MLKNMWQKIGLTTVLTGAFVLLTAVTGCQSDHGSTMTPSHSTASAQKMPASPVGTNSNKSLVLHDGDTLKIDFPGAPNLNTTQAVRRDGKISLSMVGEYDAADKTPAQVEADLKKLYASQIVNSEVSVTVPSHPPSW